MEYYQLGQFQDWGSFFLSVLFVAEKHNMQVKNVIAPGETVQRTYTRGYRARDRRSLHVRHDEGRVRPEQRRLAGEWSVCVWVDG